MSSNTKTTIKVLGVGDLLSVRSYARSLENFEIVVDNLAYTWVAGVVDNRLKTIQKYYDMILLCGGTDISPTIYDDPNPFVFADGSTGLKIYTNPERDDVECKVIDAALGKLPILGICRGLQILWAKTGGKLIHDINPRHSDRHQMFLREDWRWMNIQTNEEQRIVHVNSLHHQGIDLARGFAPGWDIVGTASDGLPEAAINYSNKIAGVQYHPEMMNATSGARWVWDKMVKQLVLGED